MSPLDTERQDRWVRALRDWDDSPDADDAEKNIVTLAGACMVVADAEQADLRGQRDAALNTVDALDAEVAGLWAALAAVKALADTWEDAPPRLAELAKLRSAEGDDSLTRALAIGRAYATALRAKIEATS